MGGKTFARTNVIAGSLQRLERSPNEKETGASRTRTALVTAHGALGVEGWPSQIMRRG